MASKASMVPFAFVKLGHQLLQPRRPPWCLRLYSRLSDKVILGANTPPEVAHQTRPRKRPGHHRQANVPPLLASHIYGNV